jgi:hypothetical protein
MVNPKINTFIMEENEVSREDIDYIMRLSYKSLTSNIKDTLNEFIVYTDGDEVVELKGGTYEKAQYIDKLIKYFEITEEFEKCKNLLDLKKTIKLIQGKKWKKI